MGLKYQLPVITPAIGLITIALALLNADKIGKGLTLGVQTSWRNYGFLFQSAEAKSLHRWAEFFGYPTR